MKADISILLPTRGRTTALQTSLSSILKKASDPGSIEILLAFDHDDAASFHWFEHNVAGMIDDAGAHYTCFGFDRLGYIRLNEYINHLAGHSQGQWLFFWGDDAIMESADWDQRIREIQDFRVLRIPTHNQHPYAIFPIVPRAWYDLFGYVSAHQLTDSWVSQIAYLLDIMHNIDVTVTHDRFDLTGNNKDDTWKNRPMLEGRPEDPRDFNHMNWRNRRMTDAARIFEMLEHKGHDMPWFRGVVAGTQDPWTKMVSDEYDPNHQLTIFK
jgi:hypothetical protein